MKQRNILSGIVDVSALSKAKFRIPLASGARAMWPLLHSSAAGTKVEGGSLDVFDVISALQQG